MTDRLFIRLMQAFYFPWMAYREFSRLSRENDDE